MPKFKALTVPYRWCQAGRARKCYHTPPHAVAKGDTVLEVKVGLGWQGYCKQCGLEMIRIAIGDLHRAESLAP